MSDLESLAIERLQAASKMSLRLFRLPLLIAYSGGKDSDVLLHLAKKSGVPYEVEHSLTTADAPETVYHVRKVMHDLECEGVKCWIDYHTKEDGSRVTMWNLIPKKQMPPTRLVRYCCAELKEGGGRNRFLATGVRWDESAARKKNRGSLEVIARKKEKSLILSNDNAEDRQLFESCQLKGKRVVNPIVDWKDGDILAYCEAEKIALNPLYGCGYRRVGCVGCPMAGRAQREREFARYPKIKAAYIRAFDRMQEARRARGKRCELYSGEDVFHWWIEDGVMPGQMDLLREEYEIGID